MAAHKQGVKRAKRNRTIEILESEKAALRSRLVTPDAVGGSGTRNVIINGDALTILSSLKKHSVDLMFADPPYNLTKNFGRKSFKGTSMDRYEEWLEVWLGKVIPLLKPTASVYICGDWRSSAAIQRAGIKVLKLRNRITWEREKGRGAKMNWKNASEDIWFFTVGSEYFYDPEAVKMKRKVVAPYTDNGKAKDWSAEASGNFRLTGASNLWTDLTVPFWSMPENTVHPTQKPEKLLAKVLLASSRKNDLVLDPFAGSGTTAAAATKLDRDFICIEADEDYCLIAQKRVELARKNPGIQGFSDGVFWERNSQYSNK